MRIDFTPEAEADLFDILAYLLPRNPTVAIRSVEQVQQRCRFLEELPQRGPVIMVRHGRELRRVLEPPFVIIYEVRNDRVLILRVFHSARDGRALLDGVTLPEADT